MVLLEGHLGRLHLVLFFVKLLNRVLLFDRRHGEVEDVDVVDTHGVRVGLGIPWTLVIGSKLKVRV